MLGMAQHMPDLPSQKSGGTILESSQFLSRWQFNKHEIENCSPSRKDGISFEKESLIRKRYCSFIKELGQKKLKVPQVTIACAWMLCHQFYMRQSLAKNDWQTIATASMFLACKIEDTPRLLRDVVIVAYEMIHEGDASAPHHIRITEFCDQQKKLITTGERLLLVTIGFDLDIKLPYRPLVDALIKMDICSDLVKVAWNYVNDWLCTALCLRYKTHYIAAGSLFLASKFQKVKLPTVNGKVWWMEFDVSPKQLEEVIREMERLLKQDKKGALPSGKVPLSRDLVRKTISSSSQSTITNASVTSSHSNDEAVSESRYQTNGSAASSIVDNDDGEGRSRAGKVETSSCKTIAASGFYNKIDSNRIRETLKKRKLGENGNKMCNDTVNDEFDGEAWIERELEIGIELESASSEDKRRRVCYC